jgi:hypothetical protein
MRCIPFSLHPNADFDHSLPQKGFSGFFVVSAASIPAMTMGGRMKSAFLPLHAVK